MPIARSQASISEVFGSLAAKNNNLNNES